MKPFTAFDMNICSAFWKNLYLKIREIWVKYHKFKTGFEESYKVWVLENLFSVLLSLATVVS